MGLINQATRILDGLQQNSCGNCYWYGWAIVGPDSVLPRPPEKNPCDCTVPALQPPFSIGWIDPNGSPLVGTMGSGPCTIALTDCSGFVAYCLSQENGDAVTTLQSQVDEISGVVAAYLQQINQQHGQNWPSAADYAALGFAGASGPFQSAGANSNFDPAALLPGDILGWGLPPGGTDTGHVVIVAATPVQQAGMWKVSAYDASEDAHESDTRTPPQMGVGSGIISLQPYSQSPSGWQISFTGAANTWHSPQYLSALRMTL